MTAGGWIVASSVEVAISPRLINILFGGIVSGEVGYRAYGDAVEWVNHVGRPMPVWEELPERVRIAWDRAAYAIVDQAYQDTGSCPCGHGGHLHDIEEADGSGRRCCVEGCRCGADGNGPDDAIVSATGP
jgi:hypothetical protein